MVLEQEKPRRKVSFVAIYTTILLLLVAMTAYVLFFRSDATGNEGVFAVLITALVAISPVSLILGLLSAWGAKAHPQRRWLYLLLASVFFLHVLFSLYCIIRYLSF